MLHWTKIFKGNMQQIQRLYTHSHRYLKKIKITSRKPVSIWKPPSASYSATSPSIFPWSGCWLGPVECCPTLQWLCAVSGYWRELEHAVVHGDLDHSKHGQWVTCLVSMQAMQLSTDPCAVHYHAETWCGSVWMPQQWASGSHHGIAVHSNCQQ